MFAACRGVADDIASMVDVMEVLAGNPPTTPDVIKQAAAVDEATPTTTASDYGELTTDDESESATTGAEGDETESDDQAAEPQLGPGLFPADADDQPEPAPVVPPPPMPRAETQPASEDAAAGRANFTPQETLFVFDWDDTILPSSWIQRQGLRLDSRSTVTDWQYEQLGQVAATATQMLRLAKRRGTVVLLTNAERGWIELSCQKFLPALLPTIENVKIVSARTTYETPDCTSPLDWKVLAFEAEIARACGVETLHNPAKRKNIHSLGDSVHEREALMRATADLPNCCTKSVKFVERPELSQIQKQHVLVKHSFDDIVQHGGNLDLTVNCP